MFKAINVFVDIVKYEIGQYFCNIDMTDVCFSSPSYSVDGCEWSPPHIVFVNKPLDQVYMLTDISIY